METYSQNSGYSRGSAVSLGGARRPVSYGSSESARTAAAASRTSEPAATSRFVAASATAASGTAVGAGFGRAAGVRSVRPRTTSSENRSWTPRSATYGQNDYAPSKGSSARMDAVAGKAAGALSGVLGIFGSAKRSAGGTGGSGSGSPSTGSATGTSSRKTNFMRYASDGPVAQAIWRYTTGPFKKIAIAVLVAVVLVCMYGPVRDWYVAQRSGEVLAQQVAICKKYNKTLEEDVSYLLSEEGVKDVANKRLNLVLPGEKKLNVVDDSSKSSSSSSSSNSGECTVKTTEEIEKELAAVVTDVPWYKSMLDTVFGFTGVVGQTATASQS